jgi:glutaconate CoA-transferase subunit B
MAAPASLDELFAILLARDFRPDDASIMVGANMPMCRAAAVMAGMTTLPNARILIGLGIHSLGGDAKPPEIYPFLFDPRTLEAEALMWQARIFDDAAMPEVFFLGGLQVDRRGNINLFGIPDGNGGWKVRGPGSVALATMSTQCRGYYIVMPRHDPRIFVERVALISALGDRSERARLGFPGGGPRLVLSPLGVFDFGDDGDMRVRSLHEGVDAAAVREATGWDIDVPAGTPTTLGPTDEELAFLRERVDVDGTLAAGSA